jgi:hypothetical protein
MIAAIAAICYLVPDYHPQATRRHSPLDDELGVAMDHVHAFSSGGACSWTPAISTCFSPPILRSLEARHAADTTAKHWL